MVKDHNQKIQVVLFFAKINGAFDDDLAGNQRPPAPPKEPAPGETPPEGGQPRQPTPGPSPGGRGAPPPPSSGSGGGGNSWRGLEFKITPGDKNGFFNNRTVLAVLVGGGIAAYFAYNNSLYKEITWKDFVSQYLLKGYVSSISFDTEK